MGSGWFSARSIRLHLTAIVVVPGCIVLGWWQVNRALSGNELSWAYAVEWPIFACYGVYLWWKLVHELPSEPPSAERDLAVSGETENGAPGDDAAQDEVAQEEEDEDEELAAYNRYLAELSAADKPKRW